MRHFLYTSALLFTTALAFAEPTPYPNPGTLAPTHLLTANTTGEITATFLSGLGDDNDHVRMLDVTTGYVSRWLMPSHKTAPGTAVNMGHVNAGDVLNFEVENNNPYDAGQVFSSDPNASTDGYNHFYSVAIPASNAASTPALYLGAQDIPLGFWWSGYSYNAMDFSVTDVVATDITPTPEPSGLALAGTGILGLARLLRRR